MPDRRKPGSAGEHGAALLTVLLLVAVMAVVTAGATQRLTLATRLAGNAATIDQARALGYAAETLAAVRIGQLADGQGGRTTLRGDWNGRRYTLPVPGGLGSARVTDGGNCFNLNSLVSGNGGPDGVSGFAARPLAIQQFQAMMEALGIDPGSAARVADSAADWIDSDDAPLPAGAESDRYLQQPLPFRTANQLMIDPSELRVVDGITPQIFATLRPWLCALPVTDLSPINVNTLLPAQAPLFAMLMPGQLPVGLARELLSRRPPGGYESVQQFWSVPAGIGLIPNMEVQGQTVMKTRWFAVETDIELAGATLHQNTLFDARENPARLVRRSWGDDG